MSDFAINVRVEGSSELAVRLRKFGTSILDLTNSMDDIGRYLQTFISGEVFASRGGVIGEPWAPLNDNYAAWKARTFPGRPPLVRTGLMQRSFRYKSTPLTSSLWNETDYFDFHDNGNGVPQRVMTKLDEQRVRRIGEFIGDDIAQKMRQTSV